MPLKIGWDLEAGTRQGGTAPDLAGDLVAETVVAGKHGIRVQRNSDDNYWNATTGAFQAGATAEADELYFRGSVGTQKPVPAYSILKEKLPIELLEAATADGLTLMVYPEGEQATGKPTTASIVTDFLP